jgi:general secretion pathway protein F
MPFFEYTAIDAKGRGKKGYTDAETQDAARRKLRKQGLFVCSLSERTPGTEPVTGTHHTFSDKSPKGLHLNVHLDTFGKIFTRTSKSELAVMTRQIATLLNAGLPLDRCLSTILQQNRETALARVLTHVADRVKEGLSFAAALEEHPRVFSTTFCTMVRAGETSGTLELVMDRLAEFAEQQVALQRKLQATLAYPVLMLVVGLGVVFFLMGYVVPQVAQIFINAHQVLPLPTRILLRASASIQSFWYVVPLGVLLCIAAMKRYNSTPRGKEKLDKIKLKFPLVGSLLRQIAIARFCRTLGTLLQNGVNLMQALDIVRSVVPNSVFQKHIDDIGKDVSEGGDLATPMSSAGVFPPTVVQMVIAGEQSGELDEMLLRISDMSEAQIASRLAIITSLMEPVMILVLGSLVGFVVLAVLLPIFEMSSLVG